MRPFISSFTIGSLLLLGLTTFLSAQSNPKTNFDEAAVPVYTLPELMKFEDGRKVASVADWPARRAEILALFEKHVYGRTPAERPESMTFEKRKRVDSFLNGKAVLEEVSIHFKHHDRAQQIDLLIIKPKVPSGTKLRTVIGLNFNGNHTIHPSPEISLPEVWISKKSNEARVQQRATEQGRGSRGFRWPVEMMIESGVALVSIHYEDIEPDFDGGFDHSVRALFDPPGNDGWGAIGAWAWGVSRAMDYLETDSEIDTKRVAVIGHSRLGKTALWAAAQDPRFALSISNNSGCGGAALSRRAFGETVARINQSFPHWFCKNFRLFNSREAELPVDQHQLIALIAPRMVYVASAEGDKWADPRGEFLSTFHASPVWRLHGQTGLGVTEMPGIGQAVGDRLRYHIRAGKHEVMDYDWQQYLAAIHAIP